MTGFIYDDYYMGSVAIEESYSLLVSLQKRMCHTDINHCPLLCWRLI